MKLHYAGVAFYETAPGINSEQIERRILMTLRFIDFKTSTL